MMSPLKSPLPPACCGECGEHLRCLAAAVEASPRSDTQQAFATPHKIWPATYGTTNAVGFEASQVEHSYDHPFGTLHSATSPLLAHREFARKRARR